MESVNEKDVNARSASNMEQPHRGANQRSAHPRSSSAKPTHTEAVMKYSGGAHVSRVLLLDGCVVSSAGEIQV